MKKKLQKSYLTDFNLLIMQGLWQAHQICSIILPKKFIELNVKMNVTTKDAKRLELDKGCDFFLENTNLKDNLTKYKCLCRNNNYIKNFDEDLKNLLFNT